MGEVYLARDQLLGRRVALKVLHENGPEDHRTLLLEEARLAARLNHPHIVTIHDLGTAEGRTYIAMEYLVGETLDVRFAIWNPTVSEALRIGSEVADALAHAHAQRVIHGDLKPQNIMLPDDGRLRVVDFGLGRPLEAEPDGTIRGTPGYLPPEAWRFAPPSGAQDIWALGVVLYELHENSLPYPLEAMLSPSTNPGPPSFRNLTNSGLQRAIEGCLAFAPSERPSASELKDTLQRLEDPTSAPESTPFPGLLPYDFDRARLFFGRQDETNALVERVRKLPRLAVVGPSGVGKSSLVLAGVAPRFMEASDWSVLSLRPGRRPFQQLARVLAESGLNVTADQLAHELIQTPERLHVRLTERASKGRRKILLICDQLEELMTSADDEVEGSAFFLALLSAANDPIEPIRILVTLRDDFIGHFAGLDEIYVLRPLAAQGLREAIIEPIRRRGYRFEAPGLVDEMLEGLKTESAHLPLLQVTLQELWARRDREQGLIRRDSLDQVGGIEGALRNHADRVLAQLPGEDRNLVRRLLLALVTPERARKVMRVEELTAQLGPNVQRLIDALATARLLSARASDVDDAEPQVELVHDALIHKWDRLRGWLDDNLEEHRALEEVSRAAEFWELRGRRRSDVWTVDDIGFAEKRLGPRLEGLSQRSRAFLEAGLAENARRLRNRRRGGLLAVLALVSVSLGSLALAAEFRRRERVSNAQRNQINLAAADVGRLELQIGVFDWNRAGTATVPSGGPAPQVRLHSPSKAAWWAPGELLQPVRMESRKAPPGRLHLQLEVRSGPAVLVIKRGECQDVRLPLAQLPGYARRRDPLEVWAIDVPSCAASTLDTVEVVEGPFLYGGPGRARVLPFEITRTATVLTLESFRIDRFEVSNRRFKPFRKLSPITGIRPPRYPNPESDTLPLASRGNHPVTSINAEDAAAFCSFVGGRLPSNREWTKAGRGPLERTEPLYPWGPSFDRARVNLEGAGDPWVHTAPVDAFQENASIYGVVNLIGNVYEWTSTEDTERHLRIVRGANFGSEPSWGHHTLAYENLRDPRYFDYGIGFRCAY